MPHRQQRPRPRAHPAQDHDAASVSSRAIVDPARDVAYRALAHQAEVYPELDLAPLDTTHLDARDAAFAHAIYDAALRRWITLGYLIEGFASRPFGSLDPRLRGVLLGGAAQILFLERVPPHAALNESVEWAKDAVKPAAGGLVNAVLRRIAQLVYGEQKGLPVPPARVPWTFSEGQLPLGDGTALPLRRIVLPESPLERLAIATSHPIALLRKWTALWGAEVTKDVAYHNLASSPTVLYLSAGAEAPPHSEPHEDPSHRVFTGTREELTALLASRPDIWVQDSSSSKAVGSASALAPQLIIDVCAGQGTKTRQLALTFPLARIIATDADQRRLATLRAVSKRHPNVTVVELEALARDFTGRADLVLLDVPCSNTGVLPRRVEARYRCDQEQLTRLVALQRSILAEGAKLVHAQGSILYSTCSIEPEENDEQAQWAASELGFKVTHTARTMPQGAPGGPAASYCDGAFSALLGRA